MGRGSVRPSTETQTHQGRPLKALNSEALSDLTMRVIRFYRRYKGTFAGGDKGEIMGLGNVLVGDKQKQTRDGIKGSMGLET